MESKGKMTKHPGFGRRGSRGSVTGTSHSGAACEFSVSSVDGFVTGTRIPTLGTQANGEKTSLLPQLKSANSPRKDLAWSGLSWEECNVTG